MRAGVHQFSFPTAIHFGAGASKLVAAHLQGVGVRRPLIVTDQGLARLPVAKEFEAGLSSAGLAVGTFCGVVGNPTASQVSAGTTAYGAHQADAVVGFGGGAALDVAKAVALMAVHEGNVLDYAWDHPQRRAISRALPPWVAVPTTSGTGSEVGRSSVISDDTTHVKKIIFAPALLAKAVFADPVLTYDLPPAITAATGIDALTHNIESYLSPAYHPLCDGIALEGVRLAARALPVAFAEGHHAAARADMMMSSLMGAVAFQKDLGAVHACAHALGAVNQLHHGLANALMLDHVMRFNRDAVPAKLAELARVSGAGTTADDFIGWLGRLKKQLGIPGNLAAAGVKPEQVKALVSVAVNDACHQTNPRTCTAADFERLFQEAM